MVDRDKELREDIEFLNECESNSNTTRLRQTRDLRYVNIDGQQWKQAEEDGLANGVFCADSKIPRIEANKTKTVCEHKVGDYLKAEKMPEITAGDDAEIDDANILTGAFAKSFRNKSSRHAFDNAIDEAMKCGFGAVMLDISEGEIIFRPIYSAPNSVIFSGNGSEDPFHTEDEHAWVKMDFSKPKVARMLGKKYGSEEVDDIVSIDKDRANKSDNTITLAHQYKRVNKTIIEITLSAVFFDGIGNQKKSIVEVVKTKKGNSQYKYEINGEQATKEDYDSLLDQGYEIVDEDVTKSYCYEYSLIAANRYIVKPVETDLYAPGVIPFYGAKFHNDETGLMDAEGLVKRLRGLQNTYNAAISQQQNTLSMPQHDSLLLTAVEGAAFGDRIEQRNTHNSQVIVAQIQGKDAEDAKRSLFEAVLPGAKESMAVINAIQSSEAQFDALCGKMPSSLPANIAEDTFNNFMENANNQLIKIYKNLDQSLMCMAERFISVAQAEYTQTDNNRIITVDKEGNESFDVINKITDAYGLGDSKKNTLKGSFNVTLKSGKAYKDSKQEQKDEADKALELIQTNTPQGQEAAAMGILNRQALSDNPNVSKQAKLDIIYYIVGKYRWFQSDTPTEYGQQTEQGPVYFDYIGIEPETSSEEEEQALKNAKQQSLEVFMNPPPPPKTMADAESEKAQASMQKNQMDFQLKQQENEIKKMELQLRLMEAEARKQENADKIYLDAEKKRAEIRKTDAEAEAQEIENELVESGAMDVLQGINVTTGA